MAISQHESGDQLTIIGTEHTLNTTTPDLTDGIFQFMVDLTPMVDADTLELRIKEKCTGTGDTIRLLSLSSFAHVQTEVLWASPSMILLFGWDFTLKQVAGSVRTFDWSIRKVA